MFAASRSRSPCVSCSSSGPGAGLAVQARPLRGSVPACGATDILARIIAERISGPLGQPIVVENRPGRRVTRTEMVARSPADVTPSCRRPQRRRSAKRCTRSAPSASSTTSPRLR